jgi:hypothetical protein
VLAADLALLGRSWVAAVSGSLIDMRGTVRRGGRSGTMGGTVRLQMYSSHPCPPTPCPSCPADQVSPATELTSDIWLQHGTEGTAVHSCQSCGATAMPKDTMATLGLQRGLSVLLVGGHESFQPKGQQKDNPNVILSLTLTLSVGLQLAWAKSSRGDERSHQGSVTPWESPA